MEDENADMALLSLYGESDLNVPEDARAKHDELDMMLVVDAAISPVKYMTPKIRACSLLLRPFKESECSGTLKEFMRAALSKRESESKMITVDSRGTKTKIPVDKIYYVEVRGKKVFLRLKREEISEYSSFDSLLEELGEGFVRCHRSFAFNAAHFDRVKISEGVIHLSGDITVPLSRSYRKDLKEFADGK